MGTQLLVTVGSDGATDWVRFPNGQKMNLGPISVLKFVTTLGKSRVGRQVLDQVLTDGEAMLSVDEDRLWGLLTPTRARWGSADGSFMPPDRRTARTTMSTIQEDLGHLEAHIAELRKHASNATPESLAEGREILVRLAQKIKSPNQSKNQTYYNLGAPDVHEVGDKTADIELSYDKAQANMTLAHQILAKAGETVVRIDKLAGAGKKFNAAKAKADVHAVTSKVAGILKMDLTASWVQEDLRKLANRTDHTHGLFLPKKG
jgi:hypothetical protein